MKNSSNGLLLIDKPTGITSFDVIRKLRKITGIKKMGHTGTLDPFASGLLPILVGKATRLSSLITHTQKSYRAVLKLGERTTTGDPEGEVVENSDIPEDILVHMSDLTERILAIENQTPPAYSAIKVNGKRAYELARANQDVELKSRPVKIIRFEVEKVDLPYLTYVAEVSAGTYIRVLSETIAEILGTVGMSQELRRLSIGSTKIENAISLSDLTPDNWREHLQSPLAMIEDIPVVRPEPDSREAFSHGNPVSIDAPDCDRAIAAIDGEIWGIGKIIDRQFYPASVLL